MRTIKTDFTIIGSGCAAMFAAYRLSSLGYNLVLVNPEEEFGIGDIRSYHGLDLWYAANRKSKDLPELFSEMEQRLRESLPAPLEQSGLSRGEHWSILSKTPIHKSVTDKIEREYFKYERRKWAVPHIKLVGADLVSAKTKSIGLNLSAVAQNEGAVVRNYGISWNAPRIGMYLNQFVFNKFKECTYLSAKVDSKQGRKLKIISNEGEKLSIEGTKGVLIFLTGEILPHIKKLVAANKESWLTGIRKRRREQHFVWFRRPASTQMHPKKLVHKKLAAQELASQNEEIGVELGRTQYRWAPGCGVGVWTTAKGPDGLERAVDEGLRLHSLPTPDTRFVRSTRAFWLDWEWKGPAWKSSRYGTYWATSFEGNLYDMMELVWSPPIQ